MSWKQLEGEPGTVRTRAQALVDAAAAMGEAATQLEHVESYSGYSSGAVKALGGRVGDLRAMVLDAKTRYEGAGQALLTYATELQAAQDKAATAISTHDSLQGSIGSAEHRVDSTRIDPLDLDTTEQDVTDHTQAVDHLRDLRQQDSGALADYDAAKADRDRAAERAQHAIERANDASDLDDSWWQKVQGWVADHTSWVDWQLIKDIADIVALVTTVAGIILSFTPLAPLGAALLVVGRIASAISFAVTLVQFARGDIGLAALTVALLFAATGGLGKLAKVVKGAGGLKGLRMPGLVASMRGVGTGVKNIGKKLADLKPSPVWKSYRSAKSDYRTLMEWRSVVRSEKNALDSLKGQDGYDEIKQLFRSDIRQPYRQLRNEQGLAALEKWGWSVADNTLKGFGTGEVRFGVPGATFQVGNGGVELKGVKSSDIPVFGHQPVQILGGR